MTIEQQRAVALASARLRLQQAQPAALAPAAPAPSREPQALTDAQRYAPSNLLPASAGMMAGQPRGGVPMPEFIKSMVTQGGPPAVGQAAGALTGPFAPVAVPVLGGLGGAGGYVLDQLRKGQPMTWGGATGATIAGAIPGGPMASGVGGVIKAGTKYGLGNLAAKVAETEIDKGHLPTVGEGATAFAGGAVAAPVQKVLGKVMAGKLSPEDILMAERNRSFRELRGEGVVVPPHEIGKGSDVLSGIGGKAALQQQAAKENQYAWNRLTREEFGLGGARPIMKQDFDTVRVAAYEPYETIKKISEDANKLLDNLKKTRLSPESGAHATAIKENNPATRALMDPLLVQAAADVDALKVARFKAQQAYDSFRGGNPQSYETWQAEKATADKLTDRIISAGESVGDEKLVERLKASRQIIAKSYAAQAATNPSNGLVDANEYGRQILNGEPLSGNLKKIGDFANSFHREAVEAGRVPAPGVNNLSSQISAAMMSQGSAPGMVMGALNNLGPKQIRNHLLSKGAQDRFVRPPTVTSEEFQAMLARFGASAQGRQ